MVSDFKTGRGSAVKPVDHPLLVKPSPPSSHPRCKWCGRGFKKKSSWQEFCKEEHRRLYWAWLEQMFTQTRAALQDASIAMLRMASIMSELNHIHGEITYLIKLKLATPAEIMRMLKKTQGAARRSEGSRG
jgi:hypothetical protein